MPNSAEQRAEQSSYRVSRVPQLAGSVATALTAGSVLAGVVEAQARNPNCEIRAQVIVQGYVDKNGNNQFDGEPTDTLLGGIAEKDILVRAGGYSFTLRTRADGKGWYINPQTNRETDYASITAPSNDTLRGQPALSVNVEDLGSKVGTQGSAPCGNTTPFHVGIKGDPNGKYGPKTKVEGIRLASTPPATEPATIQAVTPSPRSGVTLSPQTAPATRTPEKPTSTPPIIQTPPANLDALSAQRTVVRQNAAIVEATNAPRMATVEAVLATATKAQEVKIARETAQAELGQEQADRKKAEEELKKAVLDAGKGGNGGSVDAKLIPWQWPLVHQIAGFAIMLIDAPSELTHAISRVDIQPWWKRGITDVVAWPIFTHISLLAIWPIRRRLLAGAHFYPGT